jgi:hypothetical protein
MADDRYRKRETPTGIGRPGKNLPAGSRFAHDEPTPGSVPITIENEPRSRVDPDRVDISRLDPRPAHDAGSSGAAGPWDSSPPPSRRPAHEPPMAAPRAPASAPVPPPPPPRAPAVSRAVDGFAATRPAEIVGPRVSNRPATSARPNERVHGSASSRPTTDPPTKQSLRLKLEGDTYYEAREGRVKVPKRRGPVLLGFLLVLALLGGGGYLWLDAHGGAVNFVAQLQRVVDPDSAPDPEVQTSITTQPAESGAVAATPGTAPDSLGTPGAQPSQPSAATPGAGAVPGATQPAAAPSGAPGQAAQPVGQPQIATGEIEAPDAPPSNAAQPAEATGGEQPAQPVAAKPKPKPAPAPKPVIKRPVHRDPVLRVQPLGDVLNAAPPDPSGAATLPPPDPPAPD